MTITRHSGALGGLVRRLRLLPESRLRELETEEAETGQPLADLLLGQGGLDKARLLAGIARVLDLEWVPDPPHRLAPDVAALVPPALARAHGVVPLGSEEEEVTVCRRQRLLGTPFALHPERAVRNGEGPFRGCVDAIGTAQLLPMPVLGL